MFGREKTVAVVLACADWRLHQPGTKLHRQLRRALGVSAFFLNAAPGPDGLLDASRAGEWAALVKWTRLLMARPLVTTLAVVAHQDCVAHPVSNEQHEADARRVAEALKRELAFQGPMVALVAVRDTDAKWHLKEIAKY